MLPFWTFIAVLLHLSIINNSSLALKILYIQPNYFFMRSHFSFALNLAKFLAKEGHVVHLLVPFRDEEDKNIGPIDKKLTIEFVKIIPVEGYKLENWMSDTTHIEILKEPTLMNKLKDENFDVGIGEAFSMTEYSLAVLHILGIPKIIATHSQPISPEHLYFLGVLSKMATKNVPVPSQLCLCPRSQHEPKKVEELKSNVNVYQDSHPKNLSPYNLRCELTIRSGTIVGDHLDKQLQQRQTEIWTNYVEATVRKIRGHVEKDVQYQKVAQENYALQSFPGLDEIFRKSRFFLVNSQPQVDFDNYNIFNGIEKIKLIGGFQLKQNGRELDEKITAKFGDRNGIVFISFGTVMDTNKSDFSYVIEAIKVTIQKFPDYLFVCKLSKGHMEGIPNVFATDEWLDQQGILANPKTKAFVSHCGMNSVLEGIYNGVPMICMPYFGDQFYNAESLARQNIGLVVDREQDKESVQRDLTEALKKILKPISSKSNEQIDFDKLKVISDEFKQESRLSKPITDVMKVIEKELKSNKSQILV